MNVYFNYRNVFLISTLLAMGVLAVHFPGKLSSSAETIFDEYGPFEILSFVFAWGASWLCFKNYVETKKFPYVLIGLASLVYGLEEISWGQVFFENWINYSPMISPYNNQAEPNFHNITFGSHLEVRDALMFILSLFFAFSLWRDNSYFSRKYSFYSLILINSLCFTVAGFIFGILLNLFTDGNLQHLESDVDYWYSKVDEVQEYFIALTVFFNFWDKKKGPAEARP